MKSTFANARESLSDAQLKHVTGGARVNSRADNGVLADELFGRSATFTFVQDMIGDAKILGDQVSRANYDPPQGLVDGNGRSDSGERENTTWPLPSAPDGGH